MSTKDNDNEFDFLPPAEPPPSFNQEKDSYHEEVAAEDFGMVEDFGLQMEYSDEDLLPENTAPSSINVGFVGVGGGGNKMANAFIELGFNKTLLVNTTGKDIPKNVEEDHVVLIPDSDGIGKNTEYGKEVFTMNGAVIEDALRIKLGKVDWLFVLAGGGGGTGSSVTALHPVFERYMKSVQSSGKVVYIVSWPTAQENLNPTIARNALTLANDVAVHPHIVLDNERATRLLRGRIGMLGMYPVANTQFAKSFAQVLKLSTEDSPIQSFDSKDLETCLGNDGRAFLGSTMIKDPNTSKLGSVILHNCMNRSACPPPKGKAAAGSLILVASEEMVADPRVSKNIESAIAYVGGRCETLFLWRLRAQECAWIDCDTKYEWISDIKENQMKITKSQLKQIIKEELNKTLSEASGDPRAKQLAAELSKALGIEYENLVAGLEKMVAAETEKLRPEVSVQPGPDDPMDDDDEMEM